MSTWLRLVIAVPVIVVMGWAGGAALDNGRADAILAGAGGEIATWTSSSPGPSAASWDWIRADLERAAILDPRNPTVHELLGILNARRREVPDSLERAATHYSNALEFRPVSPYSWANLVEVKYQLGRPVAEIEAAIARAAYLGPSEPAVQRIVALYGLAVWSEMTGTTQGLVERVVASGLRRNPLEMLQISERRGRLEVACRHISGIRRTTEGKWTKFCQSTEATP